VKYGDQGVKGVMPALERWHELASFHYFLKRRIFIPLLLERK